MTSDWQPSASLDIIRQRAEYYKTIRRFMEERDIMEVQTPIFSNSGNTDPNLSSFNTQFHSPDDKNPITFYLNTSPEFAMKRLLAAGSGSIYQICKVFRDYEAGIHHQPEFTMLEWYRIGYDHHQLMDDLSDLLSRFGFYSVERMLYSDVFESCTGVHPHLADSKTLLEKAKNYGLETNAVDRGLLLDFIFTQSIAPALTGDKAVILFDFPACQASLAKIRNDEYPVAERFELFIDGVEIANGFHELCDAKEQMSRFEEDNRKRKIKGQNEMPIDKRLVNSLEHGLPECAGIAVGLDRLFMKMKGRNSIEEVVTFSYFNS